MDSNHAFATALLIIFNGFLLSKQNVSISVKCISVRVICRVKISGYCCEFDVLCCCSKFMRVECYNSRYAYDTALPVSRLVSMVGNSILWLATLTCAVIVIFHVLCAVTLSDCA